MVAMVIDDFGSSRQIAVEFTELWLPLTWAILPFESHSSFCARTASEAGIPYLVHMPMSAVNDAVTPANGGVRDMDSGMPPSEMSDILLMALESLPDAVGLNNHRGSRATADAGLMRDFMEILSGFSLVFLDSRTTSLSTAYDKAVERGVPAAYSSVFLDNQADEESMRAQLLRGLAMAERRGWVVLIGHARSATLGFLKNTERAAFEDVLLLTLPELIRRLDMRPPSGNGGETELSLDESAYEGSARP